MSPGIFLKYHRFILYPGILDNVTEQHCNIIKRSCIKGYFFKKHSLGNMIEIIVFISLLTTVTLALTPASQGPNGKSFLVSKERGF